MPPKPSSTTPRLLRSFINGKYWPSPPPPSSSSPSPSSTSSSSSSSSSSTATTNCYNLQSAVTGQLRATVEPATAQACDAALEAAHQIQPHWHREFSPTERSQLLLRAADLFLQDEEMQRIARMETEDTGRPVSETQFEAAGAADCLQWFAGLTRSVGGQHMEIPSSAGAGSARKNNFGYTRREPIGVTVGIGAWNYPMQSAIWKSAPALAFGNTMVFKPSEFTPQTALRVAEIYQHVGIPDGVFNVVLGTGPTVGKQLVEDPRVGKVSFTGSVPTGRHIYTSAAKDFKRVTLELGGKSPLIIFEDSNLESAVSGAMMANWYSSGQVCSNGTRVFVQRNILDAFTAKLMERTAKLKIGDPMHPETQIGPLINEAHRKKVQEYIRIGIEEDDQADLIYGGRRILTDQYPNGNFLEPTIFVCRRDDHDDCRDDNNMRIVQEEIFGPVMAILPFDSEEEVLQRANNTPFGLAAGVFTKDLQRAHRMVAQLNAGITWINNYNLAPAELPWGGFGQSGIGSENGLAGAESWTRIKSVYVEMDEMESPYY